ncbi:MAG: hypothetical protein FJY66_04585, partial [Calditrichaeota bacterium]|nr:hypothetical protein [Calditrichota bacterium]
MIFRRSIRLLIPVAILFLFVRLVYLRQLEASPLSELLTLDAKYYHDWAAKLAQGLGHPPGPFFLSPLYPILLSAIYTILGQPNPAAAVIFQIFLSTATLVLLFFAVRCLFDDTTALMTSTLALLYSPWLYFDGMLLTSSLILFLNAALLWILASALSRKIGWQPPPYPPASRGERGVSLHFMRGQKGVITKNGTSQHAPACWM